MSPEPKQLVNEEGVPLWNADGSPFTGLSSVQELHALIRAGSPTAFAAYSHSSAEKDWQPYVSHQLREWRNPYPKYHLRREEDWR